VADSSAVDRALTLLEADLKQLETEYNMFFGGLAKHPPWEMRGRVEAMARRLDREELGNYGNRFRFSTIQSRLATFIRLWDRGLRALEEGRPGPFARQRTSGVDVPTRAEDRVLGVTTLHDPLHETDKLRELYDRLADARREAGQEGIPFQRFAELVQAKVSTMKEQGSREVAFRVAIKHGQATFTMRAMKVGEMKVGE
jgi:hypothetical protein